MKKYVLIFGVSCAVATVAVAQSNEIIDQLLRQDIAQPAEVSYLVLVAAGQIEEDASPTDALGVAWQRGYFDGQDAVRLGDLSFSLMDSFQVRGGIMYAILPGPRYATRELAFHQVVPGRTHPSRVLSGREALEIVERFLNWRSNS